MRDNDMAHPPAGALPRVYRMYIARERVIGSIVNFVLSLVFTILLVPAASPISLWGPQGIAVDLVPTVFMLTLAGSLAITLLAKQRLRSGAIKPIPGHLCGAVARALPDNVLLRIVMVAVVVTAVVVPASVVGLALADVRSMSYGSYLAFKSIYGPFVGALSTATVVKAALRNRGAR